MSHADLADALCQVCRRFGARGWCPATGGNFSARVGADRFLITESGKDKSRLETADLMLCDAGGTAIEPGRQPSAETPLHALLYALDERTGSVMHTHSVAATVLSRSAGACIEIAGYEMQKAMSSIATHESKLAVPVFDNSQDMAALASRVRQAWQNDEIGVPGFVIRGHGLYAWGPDIGTAQRHVEGFEFLFECLHSEARRQGG